MNDIRDNLPQHLKVGAISLESLGMKSWAWNLRDAEEVIECLKQSRLYIILGGDVYRRDKDGAIHITHDNWHYEPVDGEGSVMKSMDVASDYLRTYEPEPDNHVFIFDFVFQRAE